MKYGINLRTIHPFTWVLVILFPAFTPAVALRPLNTKEKLLGHRRVGAYPLRYHFI